MSKGAILFKEIGIGKLLTLRSWHKAVLPHVRGFYVSRCLQGLEICGCLDVLRKSGSLNVDKFIKQQGRETYNKEGIDSVCNYLYSIGIFDKKDEDFTLSKEGMKICLNRHGYFDFVHAYGPIFYELPALLMGEKVYRRDFSRNDRYVAKATAEVSEWLPLPAIRHLIKKYHFKKVLDLGCGRGELLLSLAKSAELTTLHGIDIANDSINDGNKKIKELDLMNKVSLRIGDVEKPESFKDWLNSADVVTIMFVLHEFLRNGEIYLVNFLKNIKALSGSQTAILIAETPKQESEKIRKHPTSIAEHHLFHSLSQQGILDIEKIRQIVGKAGLRVIEDIHFSKFSQHYILVK